MTNVAEMKICLYDRVENTVGKGENAGYQHFLLLPLCFSKPSSLGSLKVRLCGEEENLSKTSPCFYMSAVQVF